MSSASIRGVATARKPNNKATTPTFLSQYLLSSQNKINFRLDNNLQQHRQECIPLKNNYIKETSNENNNPNKVQAADVGILETSYCHPGYYCVESLDSSLGGYCLEEQQEEEQEGSKHRSLVTIDFFTFVSNDICNNVDYTCTCNLDTTTRTGAVSCQQNQCDDFFFDPCSISTYNTVVE